jgi:GLPGLI family protein
MIAEQKPYCNLKKDPMTGYKLSTSSRMLFAFLFLASLCPRLQAQNSNTIFLSEGKIEFEKKLNVYAGMDNNDTWTELEKKSTSQFRITYFDMVFTRNKTLYKPGREIQENNRMEFFERPSQDNVVYSELDHATSISQKKVFEQLFLIQDSLRTIKWKITDENRTIAGFACRRANAIIMDSIYVVAFYTDEILTTGGPESFNGLPGMILGVALPHQHVSWFATKVQATAVSEGELAPPVKGKKVNNEALKKTLTELVKNWGKNGREYVVFTML